MNILYMTSVFPRPQEGATIYTDLAEELLRRGHAITVVVADGDKTAPPFARSQERGMEVLRVRTKNMYNTGLIRKGLAHLTLNLFLKKAVSAVLRGRSFDWILFETPPVSFYKTVAFAKKMFHAPAFLMLKDIFPQNGVDLGIYTKNSLVYRLFKRQEKKLYQTADIIGCMSPANREYLEKHHAVARKKTVLFPNTKAIAPLPQKTKSEIRKQFGLPEDRVIFVCGGNVGLPQCPDFMVRCAKAVCKEKDAFFLVVGRGTHRSLVQKALAGVQNFRLIEELPRTQYEELLFACDIGVLLLDNRFTVPNFPSRILSYMNCGVPVLAATDAASDIRNLILDAGCGLWCRSENPDDFLQCAIRLMQDADGRKHMGENGYRYFLEHLTVEKSAQWLTQHTDNLLHREGNV